MPSMPAKVVVACADHEVRRSWREQLERRGWVVTDAAGVRVAIDATLRDQPQAIIAATPLPDASGYHFVRTLRGVVEHDVKIVGVKGDGANADIAFAGFDLIIEGSIDFDSLHRFIAVGDEQEEKRPTSRLRPLKPQG